MRIPEPLVSLIEEGIIEDVVRPLMSGKEAQVYLVVADGAQYVAKIYKEADQRTFKHRSDYTEGRRVRSTRDQRAMNKRSRYGRSQDEASWRAAEANVIYRLRDAGVQVPEPRIYFDNVLVMELVTDKLGNPAPRLADVQINANQAEELLTTLMGEVVKMLCAGLVHGDLSEFNILLGANGAVIIDFPQAVDSATNRNARKLLIRDIGNLTRFFGKHRRHLRNLRYGDEIWNLYEQGQLTPQTVLTGRFKPKETKPEISSLLAEMEAMDRENKATREALGLPPARPARQPRPADDTTTEHTKENKNRSKRRRKRKPRGTKAITTPNAQRHEGTNPTHHPKGSTTPHGQRRPSRTQKPGGRRGQSK